MSLKCGIIGLPNIGKSTLFNALTQSGIEAAQLYLSAPSSPMSACGKCPTRAWRRCRQNCESARELTEQIGELSTLPAWWQARARARAWATSFSPTSANRCDC